MANTLLSDKYSPVSEGPFFVEYWQVASGGAAGDTSVIVPNRGRHIVEVTGGPYSSNLSTLGTSTNVTLTLIGGTDTQGAGVVRVLTRP
ncbi:MAG TPA: hypothetical protein VD948_12770 [Rhodothermales bacterium]|nr:hypothetical protein [Rhodothermales bacterium]